MWLECKPNKTERGLRPYNATMLIAHDACQATDEPKDAEGDKPAKEDLATTPASYEKPADGGTRKEIALFSCLS
jgi:hypothetical protein